MACVDGTLCGAAIEALSLRLVEHAPVDVGAEDAAGGADDGFVFAVASDVCADSGACRH